MRVVNRMDQDGHVAVVAIDDGGSMAYRVAIFNPGRNKEQVSLLRLINPGASDAEVTITGIDDGGRASDSESGEAGIVRLSIPAAGARTVSAAAMESAADRAVANAIGDDTDNTDAPTFEGELGSGTGKWQLIVTSDLPVMVMSLLQSPTGHLTNLSTAPFTDRSLVNRTDDVCDRTPQVTAAILAEAGAASCDDLTAQDVFAIEELDLRLDDITALKSSDFVGLTGLRSLDLNGNRLTTLPETVFSGLTELRTLNLSSNSLNNLPESVFSGLTGLQTLNLIANQLTTLPEGIFSGLSALESIHLFRNPLTHLLPGTFSGLSSLQTLDLAYCQPAASPHSPVRGNPS